MRRVSWASFSSNVILYLTLLGVFFYWMLPAPVFPVKYLIPSIEAQMIFFWRVYNRCYLSRIFVFFICILCDVLSSYSLGINCVSGLLVSEFYILRQRRFEAESAFRAKSKSAWTSFCTYGATVWLLKWILLSFYSGEFVGALRGFVDLLLCLATYPLVAKMFSLILSITDPGYKR